MLGEWLTDPRTLNKPEEAAFQLRVGKGECAPVEHRFDRCSSRATTAALGGCAKSLGIDQSELVRFVDGAFQSLRREHHAEIDQRTGGRGDRNALLAGDIFDRQ